MRPCLIPALGLTAACVLTGAVGCSKSTGQPPATRAAVGIPVTVAKVETVPLDRSVSIIGTLYPKDAADVAAQVDGQVEKTRVEFGDRVRAGQELALIDTTSYGSLARQAAANLAKAKASALNAEQNLKRTQDLQKDKIASTSDLDLAVANAEQAQAEVKAAEAAAAIADLNVDRSHVKAPFDGAVADRIASAGDYEKIGAPLFRLVNDAVLKFIFPVPERYGSFVQKGLPVTFGVDNYPNESFTGSVYLISPAVTMSSRAFNVGALVTNTDFRLKANTFARGTLVLEHAVTTPVVPLDSIVSFAGVTKVFVIEGNVAHSRAVTVGRIRDGLQEIVSGLRAGETVAVTGQSKLSDGAAVAQQAASAQP